MPAAAPNPEATPPESSGESSGESLAAASEPARAQAATRGSAKRGRARAAESSEPTESTKPNKSNEPTEPTEPGNGAEDLSFRQAQAALELCLAKLQASDLDVEAMGELHRRAESYVQRCEQLLEQAEQDVMQWDPVHPDAPPATLAP